MVTASYQYRADRADGMRVSKQTGGVTTLYRHDGQMGMEDVEVPSSGASTVTRYGLGRRGVDLIERTNGSGTVTAFPVYDVYGNNVASLTRNGTGFSIGDRRTYDAWGVVRAQQSGGDPKLRYCASLGHRQDDESGLVYMRARYYEPVSGRFVSEDPANQGINWFVYCGNMPLSAHDPSGCSLLLDDLISDMESLRDEISAKNTSQAGGNFAKQKLGDAFAYGTGRLVGMMAAMEIEDLGTDFFTSGTGYGYGSGGDNVHIDFNTSHTPHPYEHIDLQGKLARFQNWYKQSFGASRIPMDKFMDGFIDGFF